MVTGSAIPMRLPGLPVKPWLATGTCASVMVQVAARATGTVAREMQATMAAIVVRRMDVLL